MTDLQILKNLKLDYSTPFAWLRLSLSTKGGLCDALRYMGLYNEPFYRLKQKLYEAALQLNLPDFNSTGVYWFPKGKVNSRLKVIKQAIKNEKRLGNG